jgi:hypothetical protein
VEEDLSLEDLENQLEIVKVWELLCQMFKSIVSYFSVQKHMADYVHKFFMYGRSFSTNLLFQPMFWPFSPFFCENNIRNKVTMLFKSTFTISSHFFHNHNIGAWNCLPGLQDGLFSNQKSQFG